MRHILLGLCLLSTACGTQSIDPDASSPNDAASDSATLDSSSIDSGTMRDVNSGTDVSIDLGSPLDTGTSLDVQTDTGTTLDARTDTGTIDVPRTDTGTMDVPRTDTGTMDVPRTDTGTMDVPRTDTGTMDVPRTDTGTGADVSMPDATSDSSTSGGVVDYTARGYYRRTGTASTLVPGIPTGYLALPPGMTRTELVQLQQDCVDRINQYRAGMLRFSNGTADPGIPRLPLNHLMGNNVCSTAQALGDLIVNGGAGGCVGSHTNAFTCPWTSSVAQNTCCMRTASTAAAIRSQLYACLQSMWDEGIGMASNAAYTTANGHWHSMRNSAFTQVSCGFAFDNNGHVWMNQDFTASRPSSVPQVCSCSMAGANDGCGGVCATPP